MFLRVFRRWLESFVLPDPQVDTAAILRHNAAILSRAEADRERAACDICSGRSQYLCPICRTPISYHSHENDFLCDTHSFVNPIRVSDMAQMDGHGRCGITRVLRTQHERIKSAL